MSEAAHKPAPKLPPLPKFHPLSELLPMMNEFESEALAADIKQNGLREEIVMLDGKILDGRNRELACRKAGVQRRYRHFNEKAEGSPIAYIVSKATHRHMTDSQKACCAVSIQDEIEKDAKARMAAGGGDKRAGVAKLPQALDNKGKSREAAGALFGVSGRYVQDAKFLRQENKRLFRDVFLGFTPLTAAVQECRRKARAAQAEKEQPVPVDLSSARILLGDCLAELEKLPAKSVRLVFTDPPYNIGKKYHADSDGDLKADEEYLRWIGQILSECSRVLTPDGSLFVMINGQYAARFEMILRGIGLHRRNTIYWWENNPENQRGNFSDAVRVIHYFVKRPETFVFHDEVRVPSRRNEIGDKRAIDAGKLPDNVWIENRIPGNALDRVPFDDAPPQLPVAIPETCIRACSDPGDTILDPFNGNGTTAIAALLHGRKYIGIEKSPLYHKQSLQWIKSQLAKLAAAKD